MRGFGLLGAIAATKKADKMTVQQRNALQQRRLKSLIAYVKKHSPYFADIYKDFDENTPLSSLPVTNKEEMMAHFDEWMTDRSITKEDIYRFISDDSNINKKLNGKYMVFTTAGSTGKPCIALYDNGASNAFFAIMYCRGFAHQKDMKSFIKNGCKEITLFADNGFYLGCGYVQHTLNKHPWLKKMVKTCDIHKPLSEIVDELNQFQPYLIISYPTELELLADEQRAGRLHIHPKVLTSSGEYLSQQIREKLSETFNCDVQSTYTCTEGGTLACECPEHHLHLNDDWVILEAVDHNNQPVPLGTPSSKVLLTNLSNRVCPFIRFEITDRLVVHNEPCKCGNSTPWVTLEGRTDDILTFENGIRIIPIALHVILNKIRGVKRSQLIQHEGNRLELRLIADDRQAVFLKAKHDIESYLASNGVTAVMYLSDKLPEAHPISGKFKQVITINSNWYTILDK